MKIWILTESCNLGETHDLIISNVVVAQLHVVKELRTVSADNVIRNNGEDISGGKSGAAQGEAELVDLVVDLHHVLSDEVAVRSPPLANDVSLTVGWSTSVGFVDGDLLEAPVHQVDQTHGERGEQVE